MDGEVKEGFKEVFVFLKSDKCNIPDDAVLHLFFDVVKKSLTEFKSIEKCCVIEFLSDIGQMIQTVDGGVVTLALEIAGWLGSKEERFVYFHTPLSTFIRSAWTQSSIRDISNRSSLFHCLSCLTSHISGLSWLIGENEDIHNEWLTILETGSSIFLQKAVVTYISRLCTAPDIESYEHFLTKIINTEILTVVRNHSTALKDGEKGCSRTTFLSILNLLQKICSSELVCRLIMSTSIVCELCNIILLANRAEAQAAVNVLKAISERRSDQIEKVVDTLATQLCYRGDIIMAQNLVMMRIQSTENDFKHKDLFLIPIKYSLSQSASDQLSQRDISVERLHEIMVKKHQLTNILCRTLANLSSIKLAVPEIVTRLLQVTVSASAGVGCGLSHLLVHNTKVQRSCLQYLAVFTDRANHTDLGIEIGTSVIQIMSSHDIEPQTYSACIRCMSTFLPYMVDSSCSKSNISTELATILQQQMCSIQWEQRDTTLEFLSEVVTRYKDNEAVINWIESNKLHHHIWQCMKDGDSYVRASAVLCTYSICLCQKLWTSLQNIVHLSEKDVVLEIAEMLETDTEAFTRRSAATFLHRFYSDNIGHKTDDLLQYVIEKMVARIHDFDWEVKMKVLTLLEEVMDVELKFLKEANDVPEYARNLQPVVEPNSGPTHSFHSMAKGLKKCFDLCCFQAIFIAVDDYDKKVVERAVSLIEKLQIKIKSYTFSKKIRHSEVNFIDYLQKALNDCKAQGAECEISKSMDIVGDTDTKIAHCIKGVLNFDVSKYRHSDSNEYTHNPLSIIRDILSYGHKSEDDNVVDCY